MSVRPMHLLPPVHVGTEGTSFLTADGIRTETDTPSCSLSTDKYRPTFGMTISMVMRHSTSCKPTQLCAQTRLTTGQVAHNQWPSGAATDKRQAIDLLHAPVVAFELFDSHFFLPDLALENVCSEHPAFHWIADWWDSSTPGSEVWIYTTGSAKHKEGEPQEQYHHRSALRMIHILPSTSLQQSV